jgi:hypothetical protein
MDWSLAGSGGDQMLLFGTANRTIKLWNVEKKEVMHIVHTLALLPTLTPPSLVQVQSEMMTEADCPRVTDISCSARDRIFVSACAPGESYTTAMGGMGQGRQAAGSLLCWDIKTAKVRMPRFIMPRFVMPRFGLPRFGLHSGAHNALHSSSSMSRLSSTCRSILALLSLMP